MLAAAFVIDWQKTGGSSFIELVSGVNLAFIAWDRFQERLKFVDRDCRNLVAQACASIIDDEHRANSETHFTKMLVSVDGVYKTLWHGCFAFGVLAVIAGFAMLFFNWNCRHDYLLLLPLAVYLSISTLVWLYFRRKCRVHCAAIAIANGAPEAQSDGDAVSAMAKGIEKKIVERGPVVPDQQHKTKSGQIQPAAKKTPRSRKR